MITEDYVSFETAKLLKEKGFDEECRAFYVKSKECGIELFPTERSHNYNDDVYPRISAPTLQMAMKWLRKVHKWHIEISRGEYGYFVHIVSAKNLSTENYAVRLEGEYSLSYEEACEAGIKYCLENLI